MNLCLNFQTGSYRDNLLPNGASSTWTRPPRINSPTSIRIQTPILHNESGPMPGVSLEVISGAQSASISYLEDRREFFYLADASIRPRNLK